MFEKLNSDFRKICSDNGLRYQLIPYFISSHPACRECDMKALAEKVLGRLNFDLEQVQDLTPTPMTLSSVMFYTGENPYTGEEVYVARSQDDKRRQKSYFFADKRSAQKPAARDAKKSSSKGAVVNSKRKAQPMGSEPKRGEVKRDRDYEKEFLGDYACGDGSIIADGLCAGACLGRGN